MKIASMKNPKARERHSCTLNPGGRELIPPMRRFRANITRSGYSGTSLAHQELPMASLLFLDLAQLHLHTGLAPKHKCH